MERSGIGSFGKGGVGVADEMRGQTVVHISQAECINQRNSTCYCVIIGSL